MICWCVPYLDILSREENLKSPETFTKIKKTLRWSSIAPFEVKYHQLVSLYHLTLHHFSRIFQQMLLSTLKYDTFTKTKKVAQ